MSTDRFTSFLTHLGHLGIELRVVDGRLRYRPIERVGPELATWLENYQRELVGLLLPVTKGARQTVGSIVPIDGEAVWAAEYAYHERLVV